MLGIKRGTSEQRQGPDRKGAKNCRILILVPGHLSLVALSSLYAERKKGDFRKFVNSRMENGGQWD